MGRTAIPICSGSLPYARLGTALFVVFCALLCERPCLVPLASQTGASPVACEPYDEPLTLRLETVKVSVTARLFVRHPELSLLCFAPYCVRDLVLCLWPLKQVVYTTQVGIYIYKLYILLQHTSLQVLHCQPSAARAHLRCVGHHCCGLP